MKRQEEPRRSARVRYWERLLQGAERARAAGDLDRAEGFFRAALTNAEEIEDAFYFGYSLGRLGKHYEDRGWEGAAERCYCRAVAVETVAYEAEDVHRVPNLGRLVLLYTKQGRADDAAKLRKDIDHVRDYVLLASPSANAYERVREAYSLGILAGFYQEAGDLEQAEELYWLELSELEGTLKPTSPYLVRPLERLASVLHQKGRVDEAAGLAARAKDILKSRATRKRESSGLDDPRSAEIPKR